MNKILFSLRTSPVFLCLCLAWTQLQAQELQYMGAGGGSSLSGGFHNSFTLGETFTLTGGIGETRITSGFQQLTVLATSVAEVGRPVIDLRIFPNPVSSELMLRGTDIPQGSYEILIADLAGRPHLRRSADHQGLAATSLDLAHLLPGAYVVFVRNTAGLILYQSIIVKS